MSRAIRFASAVVCCCFVGGSGFAQEVTWTPVQGNWLTWGGEALDAWEIDITSDHVIHVVAGTASGGTHYWRSTDDGETWTHVSLDLQLYNHYRLSPDGSLSIGRDEVLSGPIAVSPSVWQYSHDDGLTWVRRSGSPNVRDVLWLSEEVVLVAGCLRSSRYGGTVAVLSLSSDAGATWQHIPTRDLIDASCATRLIEDGQGRRFIHWGTTWYRFENPWERWFPVCSVENHMASHAVVTLDGDVLLADQNKVWLHPSSADACHDPTLLDEPVVHLNVGANGRVYALDESGAVHMMNADNGWSTAGHLPESRSHSASRVTSDARGMLYAISGGVLYKSILPVNLTVHNGRPDSSLLSFRLGPNPASSHSVIHTARDSVGEPVTVTIVDLIGRPVSEQFLTHGRSVDGFVLRVDGLPSGGYLVIIRSGSERFVQTLFVTR